MLVFSVIPFLLVVLMPDCKETSNGLEYEFDVKIQTKLGERLDKLHAASADVLSLTIRCRLFSLDKLKCSIEQVDHYYAPGTNTTFAVPSDGFSAPPVNYERIPFVMTFDINGSVQYHIDMQDDMNKSFLLDMYRVIGDQLSIGTDIVTPKGFYFTERESSIIGSCLTFYQVYRRPGYYMSHHLLQQEIQMLGNQNFSLRPHETLHISKYRYLDNCSSLRDYLIGSSFWPHIIPQNLTAKMNESRSEMSITSYSFTSMTAKTFELFNESAKVVGVVHEMIKVKLTSVEETKSPITEFYTNIESTYVKGVHKEKNL